MSRMTILLHQSCSKPTRAFLPSKDSSLLNGKQSKIIKRKTSFHQLILLGSTLQYFTRMENSRSDSLGAAHCICS